jgi:hypothetical protein
MVTTSRHYMVFACNAHSIAKTHLCYTLNRITSAVQSQTTTSHCTLLSCVMARSAVHLHYYYKQTQLYLVYCSAVKRTAPCLLHACTAACMLGIIKQVAATICLISTLCWHSALRLLYTAAITACFTDILTQLYYTSLLLVALVMSAIMANNIIYMHYTMVYV